MSILLDTRYREGISEAVLELLDGEYGPEESIPGLVDAIVKLAALTSDPERACDEAVRLIEEALEEPDPEES